AIHLLPERADPHRVAADEELAIVLERADHGALAAGQPGLAPAVEAFVGLDLDDQLVAVANPDDEGRDGSDLHDAIAPAAVGSVSPPRWTMKSTIASRPCPERMLVKTKGRDPRILRASRSITSREAPTSGARSILLMTRRSE